jgi:L-alanine-DL-glutamate epimerase-like enolase superfamily enzyme
MKITAIETYPVHIPLKPAFRMVSSLGKHDVSEYVIVRMLTDGDVEGVGEATATVRWSGETVWGVRAVIDRVFAPAVIGCDPCDIAEIERRINTLAAHNWFAKSAVEMACWDIQGKAAGKPVYELLGGACRGLSIRGRFSMGAYDVERARTRAAELVAQGFDTIKVKVGGEPARDIARVRAVREVIGPDRSLVIDANCGWDADTAVHCVNELEDCRLSLVEQPTPDGDYAAMARVRRETKPPVMADDICFNMVHARELIRNNCCDVISLYPGKNGGIRKSQQIAEFAATHGVACTIGSNLEWDIATAAMGHLVVATENMQVEKYPGDIYGPIYHELRVAKNPLAIEGPITTITDRPGLGIDVDWDMVRAHRCE